MKRKNNDEHVRKEEYDTPQKITYDKELAALNYSLYSYLQANKMTLLSVNWLPLLEQYRKHYESFFQQESTPVAPTPPTPLIKGSAKPQARVEVKAFSFSPPAAKPAEKLTAFGGSPFQLQPETPFKLKSPSSSDVSFGGEQKPTPFKFGAGSTQFKFGTPAPAEAKAEPVTDNSTDKKSESSSQPNSKTEQTGFQFGGQFSFNQQASPFTFSAGQTTFGGFGTGTTPQHPPVQQEKSEEQQDDKEEEGVEEVDVEVKQKQEQANMLTKVYPGEEDETVLKVAQVKVKKPVEVGSSQFTQMGVHVIKLLKNKDGKTRLVARTADGLAQVRINVYVSSQLVNFRAAGEKAKMIVLSELNPPNDTKMHVFVFSDGKLRDEFFAAMSAEK